ncbi:hypothetical protein ABPG75_000735 [Micractinium tetrahymenae]
MAFSGAVKIGDLNDFIAPSQACVVSLQGGKLDPAADAEVQLQQRPRGGAAGFSQTLPAAPDQAVKVSLHDCLACSGCVTTAETVLLQHQSTGELLQRLADPGWTVLVSLSPQSVAALAALHGLPAADCGAALAAFLRGLGVRAVFDAAAARHLALAEAATEFVQRYRASARGAAALAAAAASGNAAASASASAAAAAHNGYAMDVDEAEAGPQQAAAGSAAAAVGGPLPMLASACPGWVCYAEKTHGDHVLPYISTGKSPQAVMGTLVKRRWCSAAGLAPDRVYHCAVMPCYDKKLEASREDFWLPGTQVPETDCVLATTELQELLEQRGVDLRSLQGVPFDSILGCAGGASNGWQGGTQPQDVQQQQAQQAQQAQQQQPAGPGSMVPACSGSGGYLEHVFRAAAWQLFGQQLPPSTLQMTVGRNADLREAVLTVDGVPVLRFAAAYGFRNIQGLMRKVKLGRCEYDYVEVMACPSGCLNGGGQPKPRAGQSAAQLLEQLEVLYAGAGGTSGGSSACSSGREPEAELAVQQLYAEWVQGPPGSAAARQLLHTQYHKREKTVTATLADW